MGSKWKFKVNNNMPDYGVTDDATKTITINKHKHHKKAAHGIPEKDNTLINTIAHELMHKDHPKMHEHTVRKLTRIKVKQMNQGTKNTMYKKFA